VHSKGVTIATAEGEFFGFYSFDVDALRKNVYKYSGDNDEANKRFVGGVISPLIYDGMDWHAREVCPVETTAEHREQPSPKKQLNPCKVQAEPFYVWQCAGDQGVDLSTGENYDVRARPWYRHAAEIGEGFTEPYPDPVTGEGMVSYVVPIREKADASVLGVVIAGSFLDDSGALGGFKGSVQE
jgi:hypothetical protein